MHDELCHFVLSVKSCRTQRQQTAFVLPVGFRSQTQKLFELMEIAVFELEEG